MRAHDPKEASASAPGTQVELSPTPNLDPYINQKSNINPKNQKSMAIYFAGYLSPIRNKLGNAVGRKWRTLDVLAVYNGRPRNPRTTAQKRQRAAFGFCASVARAFSSAVNLGFKAICDGTPIPQRSMFIKKNISLVDASTPDAPIMTYADIVCAEGGLPNAAYGSVDVSDPLSVTVTLTDTSTVPGAAARDQVYLFIYNSEANQGLLAPAAARNDEDITVSVPAVWNGERVHVFGFVYNPDVNQSSDSVYVGTGTIS